MRLVLAALVGFTALAHAEPGDMTFGVDIGAGVMVVDGAGSLHNGEGTWRLRDTPGELVIGAELGVHVTPRLALVGRVVVSHISGPTEDVTENPGEAPYEWFVEDSLTHILIAPSLEYWPIDQLRLAIGAGPSGVIQHDAPAFSWNTLAIDARIGVVVSRQPTIDLSLELVASPDQATEWHSGSTTLLGVAAMVGLAY